MPREPCTGFRSRERDRRVCVTAKSQRVRSSPLYCISSPSLSSPPCPGSGGTRILVCSNAWSLPQPVRKASGCGRETVERAPACDRVVITAARRHRSSGLYLPISSLATRWCTCRACPPHSQPPIHCRFRRIADCAGRACGRPPSVAKDAKDEARIAKVVDGLCSELARPYGIVEQTIIFRILNPVLD